MKTKILLIALLFAGAVFGQDNSKKADKIKSLKVAFITSELQLTPEESAKFWPVYNEFEARQRDLRKKEFGARRGKSETISDKEASAILSQMEANEEELLKLRKKLTSDLRQIISPVKILKLKKAEGDFNRKLLKQYRAKR
ncbi:MAG TPA: hypothetical protein VKZ68_05310 [Ohtaekwangia sp.]|nr:hypothetical protein [Ohtaekwangia sp.]